MSAEWIRTFGLAVVLAAGNAMSSDGEPVSTPNAMTNEPPAAPSEPYEGDPVGVFTGNAYEVAEDLRVVCPDIDLAMFRSYSSGSMREGPLGFGWTHAYDWSVVRGGGQVVVHASGEFGLSDVAHVFAVPAPGSSVWNADGYELRLSADGLWSVVAPDALTYSFDAANRLSSITSWNGTRVDIARDGSGRVASVAHSCGKSISFTYGVDGTLSRVSTPDPSVWAEYSCEPHGTYAVLGAVIRHDGARASTNLYRYASSPRPGVASLPPPGSSGVSQRASPRVQVRRPVMTGKTDANGVDGSYEYIRPDDSPHVRCARTSLSGGLFSTALSFGDGATEVESPFAWGTVRTRYTCDLLLRETSRTVGVEGHSKAYDAQGDVVVEVLTNALTGAFAKSVSSYDAHHRTTSFGMAYGASPAQFASLSWDDRRNIPQRLVSPEGRVAEWTADGNEVVVYGAGTNDSRAVARMLLDVHERPVSVFSPNGGRTDIAYDSAGYETNVVSSCLPPVSCGHDALGRVDSVSIPGPGGTVRTMSSVNNWRGNPLHVGHFDGTSESFEYEGNGRRIVKHVDPLGREDEYKWVLGLPVHAGRVVNSATNALFGIEHDKRLNVVAITDPLGRNAETYVLDANERVVAVTNLEGQAMTREYALGSLVASETRFDGTTVWYGYDADGNKSSIIYPDEALAYSYDGDGLLLSASNSVGVVSNVFDAVTGWLASSCGADGTAVSYSRRNDGGVAAMTSVAGTVSYSCDAADRVTHLASSGRVFDFGYCEWNGMLAAATNGNGLVSEYAYDVMDRVTNISWKTASGVTLGGFAYEYDAAGRIVSRSHTIGSNAFDRVYLYDDLDRLASDNGVAYTYDAAGNRMARTEDGATVTYTLGVGDRLASWTGGSYTYDAAGNVTRIERAGKPTLDLTWNSLYQLASVSTNGVFAEGYEYDALGRRASTTTLEGTTRHVYDDRWQVIADLDEDGNVIVSYTWGDGIDNLLAVRVGGASYYPLTDIQGTVWGYVDSSNIVVARWQYDAWGNIVDECVLVPALSKLRYRFQGREWSAATGLVNFRMRWYDGETGRWLSKDPIGIDGGLNLYCLCENEVTNCIDWNGCGKFKIFAWSTKLFKKNISRESAKKILRKGGTVTIEGRGVNKAAKRLCEEVTNHPVVRHDPHGVGWHPHYQPKSGGFHVNVPGANFGVLLLGDGFWGNALDFFNPLSDIQEVIDFIRELCE